MVAWFKRVLGLHPHRRQTDNARSATELIEMIRHERLHGYNQGRRSIDLRGACYDKPVRHTILN